MVAVQTTALYSKKLQRYLLCPSFNFPKIMYLYAAIYPGGTTRKIGWVGGLEVMQRFPRTLNLFMTKICDIPYPLCVDLTKNSKPCLWPNSLIKTPLQPWPLLSYRKHTDLWEGFCWFSFWLWWRAGRLLLKSLLISTLKCKNYCLLWQNGRNQLKSMP